MFETRNFPKFSSKEDTNTEHFPWNVGTCTHGMARPQFADGGTASNREGSCEYIE